MHIEAHALVTVSMSKVRKMDDSLKMLSRSLSLYIYVCVCVCVCVYIHLYMYIYI